MHRIAMTITFTDENGASRSEYAEVETPYAPDSDGEHRLAHNLMSELKVAVRETPEPKHNARARKWLEFPKRAVGFESYFDIQNSQAIWLELSGVRKEDGWPTAFVGLQARRALSVRFVLHVQ
jgi:hypothetical protein